VLPTRVYWLHCLLMNVSEYEAVAEPIIIIARKSLRIMSMLCATGVVAVSVHARFARLVQGRSADKAGWSRARSGANRGQTRGSRPGGLQAGWSWQAAAWLKPVAAAAQPLLPAARIFVAKLRAL